MVVINIYTIIYVFFFSFHALKMQFSDEAMIFCFKKQKFLKT